MKTTKTLLLMTFAMLVGCGENTPTQTVDWYKTHDAERKEMVAKCNNNPGEFMASPNCINATSAQNKVDFGSLAGIEKKPLTFNRK